MPKLVSDREAHTLGLSVRVELDAGAAFMVDESGILDLFDRQ